MYVCSNSDCKKTTNADVNGATNILKKYLNIFGKLLKETRVVGGLAHPLVNLFVQRKTELSSREQSLPRSIGGTFRVSTLKFFELPPEPQLEKLQGTGLTA